MQAWSMCDVCACVSVVCACVSVNEGMLVDVVMGGFVVVVEKVYFSGCLSLLCL